MPPLVEATFTYLAGPPLHSRPPTPLAPVHRRSTLRVEAPSRTLRAVVGTHRRWFGGAAMVTSSERYEGRSTGALVRIEPVHWDGARARRRHRRDRPQQRTRRRSRLELHGSQRPVTHVGSGRLVVSRFARRRDAVPTRATGASQWRSAHTREPTEPRARESSRSRISKTQSRSSTTSEVERSPPAPVRSLRSPVPRSTGSRRRVRANVVALCSSNRSTIQYQR